MRSDDANHILGLRVNVWTSILVFLLGVAIVWFGRRREVAGPARGRHLNIRNSAAHMAGQTALAAILPAAVAKAVHARDLVCPTWVPQRT